MSSTNWKKVLLYGGAGTAAVAFYLWRKASVSFKIFCEMFQYRNKESGILT